MVIRLSAESGGISTRIIDSQECHIPRSALGIPISDSHRIVTRQMISWQAAIYEHKAALINRKPLEVASSRDLFAKALLRELEHRWGQGKSLLPRGHRRDALPSSHGIREILVEEIVQAGLVIVEIDL